MANSKQAKKRARQVQGRELHNASIRSSMRTAIKKVLKLAKSDSTAAKAAYTVATKLLDKAAKLNIIHKNKASRLKSRLNNKLRPAA